ncbi:nestin [Nerophis ophidion]|uniref:nestin n=1 Tax=Nerophis ophidion TaxID=159077 RepID=UPI002AE0408C|nr:nestin [Nerophis ophidion]
MERHAHAHFQRGHLAQEKHQMLDLNRRLESYLGRVKSLEEENAQLAQEIRALRRGNDGASAMKRSMEKELREARVALDAAWRDRVCTEIEVSKLSEELQVLDWHWQQEAQAQVEAKTKVEVSRKELEEEHRAQRWLREKIGQLENEMSLLVQTHQQDVAHLEATLTHSTASVPTHFAQRGNATSDLHQLEQELHHRATRAWQEMAEAYQAQLVELEETLNQNQARLSQADREKSENQAKLRALERDMVSAQDVRLHLERSADQQQEEHMQNIHTLQEQWEGLEREKEDLGQQLDLLVVENRGLLQEKMSLSLEVATYRALLDGEGLQRNDGALQKQPRNIYFTDAPLKTFRENYQPSVRRNTAPLSSPLCRQPPTFDTTTLLRSTTKTTSDSQRESRESDEENTTTAKQESLYPKILQEGAVEEFRAQEVDEKVTYAEPLSPPGEDEEEEHPDGDMCEDDVIVVEEKAAVSFQLQSSQPPLSKELIQKQSHSQEKTSDLLEMTEDTFSSSAECDQKQRTDFSIETSPEEECVSKDVQEQTEALVQATPESRTILSLSQSEEVVEEKAAVSFQLQSSQPPLSKELIQKQFHSQEKTSDLLEMTEDTFSSSAECDQKQTTNFPIKTFPEEECMSKDVQEDPAALVQVAAESRTILSLSQCEEVDMPNISKDHTAEIGQEIIYSTLAEAVDTLYPDGEEMDTWDSVMKKIHVESNVPKPEAEVKTEYAEPEEDISTRRSEPSREDMKTQDDHTSNYHEEHSQSSNNQEDEDEDSQNVSVSWRTELESDSYAQENTLADTRPLIRYKSDETDANTQASHMDESESSDGEQDQKTGDAANWTETKAKNFGTMEDLCEDVEEEAVECEQECSDDKDAGVDQVTLEASEVILDEDVRRTPVVLQDIPYDDEELDTDRFVELELENLSTDRYASHFAQQLDKESETELLEDHEDETMTMEQKDDEKVNSCMNTDVKVEDNLETKDFTRSLVDSQEVNEDEDNQVASEVPGRKEIDFVNFSMETHIDETFSEFNRIGIVEEVTEGEIEDIVEEEIEVVGEETEEVLEEKEVEKEIEKVVEDNRVASEAPGREEDFHFVSMETHADETFSEFLNRTDMVEEVMEEEIEEVVEVVGEETEEVLEEEIEKVSEEVVEDNRVASEAPGRKEEDFHSNVSMETHADETFSEFLNRTDMVEEVIEEVVEEEIEVVGEETEEVLEEEIEKVSEEVVEDNRVASEAPGRKEEDFHSNVSMETHADETFSEFLNRTDRVEEVMEGEKEEVLRQETQKVGEETEVVLEEEVIEEEIEVVGEDSEEVSEEEIEEIVEQLKEYAVEYVEEEEMEEVSEEEIEEVVEKIKEYKVEDKMEEVVEEVLVEKEVVAKKIEELVGEETEGVVEEEMEVVREESEEVVREEEKEVIEEVVREETEKVVEEVVVEEEVVEEEKENQVGPKTVLENLKDLIPKAVEATSCLPGENLAEDTASCLADEWTVLENLSKDFDITALSDEDEACGETAQSRPCDSAAIFEARPVEISPDTALEENVIIAVKDSAEFLKTNGRDKQDFWAASLGDSAAFRTDDDATENTNVTFGGGLAWGKAVNGNSAHGRTPQEGGSVHSEESEAEGGCWSSGDE